MIQGSNAVSNPTILTLVVTYISHSCWGFGLDIVFIDHFNTQLVITLNYSIITNFHTLQITRAHAKSFQAHTVFTSN
jgi:hypothetical protein